MRRFETYEDENGRWRWRLWSDEGKILATSGEAYGTHVDALLAADAVREAAAGAAVAGEPGLGIAAAGRLLALLGDAEPASAPRQPRRHLRAVPNRRPGQSRRGRGHLRIARR